MRREVTLKGGEKRRRSHSNASRWRIELRDNPKRPSGSSSDNGKFKLNKRRTNAVIPTQKISIELSIISRNSGSVTNGFGS